MKTFIVKIEAGLGNQMFQYAHARALQLEFGGRIILDTSSYTPKQYRSFGLKHFRLCLDIVEKKTLTDKVAFYIMNMWQRLLYNTKYRRKESSVRPLIRLGFYHQPKFRYISTAYKPVWPYSYIRGNFMSEKFFEKYSQLIREDFQIDEPMREEVLRIAERIKAVNAVCVHIRLGDYLAPEWRDILYVCKEEYYEKAVEVMKEKTASPVFFIFSNTHKDFQMIKEQFHLDGEVVYVDEGNTDYEDMWLMSQCRHFIMSNSTYSWWAQYLGNYEEKVVVAPSRFNKYPRWDMTDIYQDNWTVVET